MSVLAVTSRVRLESVFGRESTGDILRAIQAWQEAAEEGSGVDIDVLFVDDPASRSSFPALDPQATASDAGSILRSIEAVQDCDMVVLLGGPRIVPHFVELNPVESRVIDPDAAVLTDVPYGKIRGIAIPVGRIPDDNRGSPTGLIQLLEMAAGYHRERPSAEGSFSLVNQEWFEMTADARAELPGPASSFLAPGWRLNRGTVSDMERRYVFLMNHGFLGDPGWKGYDPGRDEFPVVINPAGLRDVRLPASTVFCGNCYGVNLEGRTPDQSCALSLLLAGAANVVGSTGLAFGSFLSPGSDEANSDELARLFWEHCTGGMGAARSLERAREGLAVNGMDAYQRKTVLEFLLLGDPTLN